jgi:geranylgeranyl diphosphate synthase type II
MVGGQVVDIESEGQDVDLATLQYIHTHKTGAMILASVQIGARLGGAEGEILKAYTHYGKRIGLAFQIADDILDVEGKPELLGKSTGADLSKRKVTYPALLGIEESKRRARELIDLAIDALSPIGEQAEPLREIAQFIIARDY